MISKLNEKLAIDVGNNPIDNVSINEVANEIKKHSGRIVFNEHPFWNTIVLALKNKEIDLNNSPIPKNLNEELLQFCKDYNITTRIKIEDYKKLYDNFEAKSNIIISGTKDISTEFLIKHPEISKIQIIDEENNEDMEQEEPYTREDFFEIRRKIDEIKEKIEIPDDLDEDKEKKIFMQVYTTLGKMIDYNYYAITKEGEKDKDLEITCRNLKDGLLKGKAVCAGYADILKNILGEFGIKAKYISRQAKEIEQYAKKIGYDDEVEMCEELGEEVPSITEFAKRFNYQDDHGHAWNSVVLDGEKYLCDLTWDADDIKCGHFPLHNCCQNLEYFNENGHDMYEEIEEGEISEISYEEQLRLSGYSEEEIERRLNNENEEYIKNLTEMLEQLKAREELESCVVSVSSEIKASDFDGIERAFDDKEKEEQVDYDK